MNILQKVSFYIQKKQCHTGLEQRSNISSVLVILIIQDFTKATFLSFSSNIYTLFNSSFL